MSGAEVQAAQAERVEVCRDCADPVDAPEHGPGPIPGSGEGWDGIDRCTWRDHRECHADRIEHVGPCPFAYRLVDRR